MKDLTVYFSNVSLFKTCVVRLCVRGKNQRIWNTGERDSGKNFKLNHEDHLLVSTSNV